MSALTTVFSAKILLSLISIGFVWLFYFFRKNQKLKKILVCTFIPFGILASWGFLNFDKNIVHTGYWDLYHYYINAKYFDELDYFDLYRASLAANAESGGPFSRIEKVRDLHTQIQGSADISSAEIQSLREKFSPERWEEFRANVKFFFEKLSPNVLTDRGYNASPTWNKTGSLITNALPLENSSTIPIMLSLDILILVAIVGIIGATFGVVPMLFFIVLFGLNPLVMRPIQFAFLRFDWLLALVASIAFWHKKKFAASGIALAISAFLRVFPLILLTGVIFQAGFDFWKKKKISPIFQKFFVAFAITAVMLFLYGSLDQANHLDFSRWSAFVEKIVVHSQASSNQRSGLSYLLPGPIAFLRLPAIVLVFSFFGWTVHRTLKANWIPLGLLLIPIVTAPASYYFCIVAILALAFADLDKKPNALALTLILLAFVLQAFDTIHEGVYHNSATSYFWSKVFLALSLALLAVVADKKTALTAVRSNKKN